MSGADVDVAAGTGGVPAATPTHAPRPGGRRLVAMWAELGNVRKWKTANAGTYSYSYADLGDLLDVASPILAKHGFALIQPLYRDGPPTVTIMTKLIHRSGSCPGLGVRRARPGTPQQTGSRRSRTADGMRPPPRSASPTKVTTTTVPPPRRRPPRRRPGSGHPTPRDGRGSTATQSVRLVLGGRVG